MVSGDSGSVSGNASHCAQLMSRPMSRGLGNGHTSASQPGINSASGDIERTTDLVVDHPPADVGVGADALGRIDVDAAVETRFGLVEDRVVERDVVTILSFVGARGQRDPVRTSSCPRANPTARRRSTTDAPAIP